MPVLGTKPSTDYRIIVSRGSQLPQAQLYAFSVRDTIPSLRIPLQPPEPEPLLDLQTLLTTVYNQARFDLAIDYRTPPRPPIKTADTDWFDTLLKEQGCR